VNLRIRIQFLKLLRETILDRKRKHDKRKLLQGQNKKGKPCRAAATDGGLCFFHANPDKAAELGRIGGRRNHRFAMESLPLPNLDTATAVRDLAARLIAEVYAGKIHPRTASALGPSAKPAATRY
jgi:hypothetical protein